ncbi:MAG TPA: SRPBCC domain-containing protein [Methanomassiliicoccales archaeon]|jgi:activator of HSP90 ATPase|nr:SRPBCC domain-containing protein [Methanomassiliicoccales archaeon]
MAMRTRTIEQKVVFPATPDEVYDAFMDPKKHAEFTESEASGSSEVGGEFSAWGGYITATNVELVRGKRIVQDWSTSEWPEGYPPSRLEIELKAVAKGTELTLKQSKVPVEQADDYDQGWYDSYWTPMTRYFERKKKRR